MIGRDPGDMRQGVSPAANEVLDLVDQRREDVIEVEAEIKGARQDALGAVWRDFGPALRRTFVAAAAARLILALEQMDREAEAPAAPEAPRTVEPVERCPGCGITVFTSSDDRTGHCGDCKRKGAGR